MRDILLNMNFKSIYKVEEGKIRGMAECEGRTFGKEGDK